MTSNSNPILHAYMLLCIYLHVLCDLTHAHALIHSHAHASRHFTTYLDIYLFLIDTFSICTDFSSFDNLKKYSWLSSNNNKQINRGCRTYTNSSCPRGKCCNFLQLVIIYSETVQPFVLTTIPKHYVQVFNSIYFFFQVFNISDCIISLYVYLRRTYT